MGDTEQTVAASAEALTESPSGLLALASGAILVAFVVFDLALNTNSLPGVSLVAAALVLFARMRPGPMAAQLSTPIASFILAAAIFIMAVVWLAEDVRQFSVPSALWAVGQLVHFAGGAAAGLAAWRLAR